MTAVSTAWDAGAAQAVAALDEVAQNAADLAADLAWSILGRAEELTWPGESYDAIAKCAQALRDSLEDDGPAEDIITRAAALTAAVRTHIGEQAAEHAAGGSERDG